MLTHLKVDRSKVRVIPNALDLSGDRWARVTAEDARRVRRDAGVAPDETVLLSVGRLEHNKGFHVLAAALAALRDHAGRIAMADGNGSSSARDRIDARSNRRFATSGSRAQTRMPGRVSERDLHAWYEGADLFVHPTLYEGSSLVTLEAMAHRRAVIATTAGGLPDKVRPGVSGWLVPPGDASALAAAISGALGQRERLAAMGAAGRTIVEREFSWDAAGAATLRLYDELVR